MTSVPRHPEGFPVVMPLITLEQMGRACAPSSTSTKTEAITHPTMPWAMNGNAWRSTSVKKIEALMHQAIPPNISARIAKPKWMSVP